MTMRVVLISWPDHTLAHEAEYLDQMFSRGLERFHIRKPKYTRYELRNYLSTIAPHFHQRCVLHSEHDLTREFDLCGVHYPDRSDRADGVSTSLHSLTDLQNLSAHYEYVFLSPIFNSISKDSRTGTFNFVELKEVLPSVTTPVFALGGITPENALLTKQLGFSGVGVLGAVWGSSHPVARFLEVQRVCQ